MKQATTPDPNQCGLWDPAHQEDPWVRKFRVFHAANPHVYAKLCELALQLKRKGRARYGINGLFEVVRWHIALTTTDQEFKLNNNLAPYYARMLMAQEPELEDFFNTRTSVADTMEEAQGTT